MRQIKINWKAIPDALKVLGKLGKEHAPSILVGAGVVGFGVTCWFVGEAAIKAETAVERVAEETERDKNDIPLKEKAKIVAPYYWKAGISGGLSVGCVLVAHKVNLTRISSLGTMYMLAKNELKEVTEKIVETDGQKKMDSIKESVYQDRRESADYDKVWDTGYGDVIFIDEYTGQPFRSSIAAVKDAINDLNARLQDDGECSLSDFLYDLGVKFDRRCADYAMFVYSTKNDKINDFNIMKYGPRSSTDRTPVIILAYADYLVPSADFASRFPYSLRD